MFSETKIENIYMCFSNFFERAYKNENNITFNLIHPKIDNIYGNFSNFPNNSSIYGYFSIFWKESMNINFW